VAFFPSHRDVRATAVAMLSSITALSSEIEGRAYGGGVLKLETREAEHLLVPVLSDTTEAALLLDEFDGLLRASKQTQASAIVDAIFDVDHKRYVVAREVFRSRRLGRKSKAA
jgi:adenine-specific DNA-methyltransferase